ncbi:hypothetical protein K449DRAFT_465924 [Hypoxylon sp. EC38]|nr:hypothetical protein K449DRAFT_465924 [Hypoxylon sp. EC38]
MDYCYSIATTTPTNERYHQPHTTYWYRPIKQWTLGPRDHPTATANYCSYGPSPAKGHPPTSLNSSFPVVPFEGSQDNPINANDVFANLTSAYNHLDNSSNTIKLSGTRWTISLAFFNYAMCSGDEGVPSSTSLNFNRVVIYSIADPSNSHQPSC